MKLTSPTIRRHGDTSEDQPTEAFDRRLTTPLILGSVLNPVNSSMIAVALIPIGVAFGAPPSETVWLVSALYLATAVGQPVVGRLVDLFGPRRLYLGATALVGVAGVMGALAPSLGVLIAARVVLGLGTCAAYPAAMSLIRSEADRTGVASPQIVLTALTVASQTTAVFGPTVGGLLIGLGGWRTIFTINIPLSLACLVLGSLRLPRAVPTPREDRPGLDIPGMAVFAVMMTALLLFLMDPALSAWYLPALTLLAGVGLALRELRVSDPFVDLRLLGGNAPLLATYGRQTLNYTCSYAMIFGFTQWLEDGRGYSASSAGLLLLPMFLTSLVVSFLTGRHPEVRGKLVVGSLTLIAACGLLLVVHGDSPIWVLIAICLLVGTTQGLNGLANQNALYHQAEPERMGSSAGLLRTFMYLGAMIASAAVAASYPHSATTTGLHQLSEFMLGCAVALLVVTLADRSLRRVGRDRAPSEQPA